MACVSQSSWSQRIGADQQVHTVPIARLGRPLQGTGPVLCVTVDVPAGSNSDESEGPYRTAVLVIECDTASGVTDVDTAVTLLQACTAWACISCSAATVLCK
jgi:hypothetical protein